MPVTTRGRGGRPSRYDEKIVRAWLAAREESAKPNGLVDVAKERARRERAQATLAEQTFLMRQRELLPRAEVEKIWAAEIAAVRTMLLASYTTHADRVFRAGTLEGLSGVEGALKDIANEVLRELANADRPVAEVA